MVPRHQPCSDAAVKGGHHRTVPVVARQPRHRHRRLVRAAALACPSSPLSSSSDGRRPSTPRSCAGGATTPARALRACELAGRRLFVAAPGHGPRDRSGSTPSSQSCSSQPRRSSSAVARCSISAQARERLRRPRWRPEHVSSRSTRRSACSSSIAPLAHPASSATPSRCRCGRRRSTRSSPSFSLNHLDEPVEAVYARSRGVIRGGGVLLASVYANDDDHPVKHAVEQAMSEAGWQTPAWYPREAGDGGLGNGGRRDRRPSSRAACAPRSVERREVAFPELGPEAMVGWRLGMAQFAHFVEALDDQPRRAIGTRARRAARRRSRATGAPRDLHRRPSALNRDRDPMAERFTVRRRPIRSRRQLAAPRSRHHRSSSLQRPRARP